MKIWCRHQTDATSLLNLRLLGFASCVGGYILEPINTLLRSFENQNWNYSEQHLLSLSLSLFDESSNDDPYKKTTPWHHYGKFSATETPEHGGSVAASEVSSSARAMQCMRAVCWTTSPFPFAFSQIHIFCILSFVSFFIIEPAVGQTISFTMWTDGSKLYPDNSYGSFKGNGKAACKLLYFHNILKFFFCCETV